MDIPQGYKQTELGIIPEDWEIVRLGDIGNFSKGAGISREDAQTGNIPAIRYGEIYTTHNYCIQIFYSYIDTVVAQHAKLLSYGDILFACSGETKEDIGKSVAYVNDIIAYAGGDIIVLSPDQSCYDSRFMGYATNAAYVVSQKSAKGQGDAVVHISKDSLAEIMLYVPQNKDEQQAIAEALSDIDGLIATLDKKIAKKHLIKQGAMQQLLTGKKRLPGFSDPWVEKKLGEILDYEQPQPYLVVSTDYVDSGFPVLTAGKSLILGYTTEQFGIYNKLPVIIFDDFTTDSKYISYPFKVKSSAMKMLTLKNNDYDLRLVYELMQQIDFPLKDHQRYWISEYSQLTISLPKDREEQTAIAEILTDMDKEIDDLEAQRDKYHLLKSGMMQKLLTGQIRLTKPLAKVVHLVPKASAVREIPVDAHIWAGHIVNRLWQSKGWGRTKLQKSLHLVGCYAQLDLGGEYIRNTAGPDDQRLMNYIDRKFKQYSHVNVEKGRLLDGKIHYTYTPTSRIQEVEMAYEQYPQDIRERVDNLLDKLNLMNLAEAEILSTLYAVWNNRIIKGERITDDLLASDFYAWSEHKADFEERKVRRMLDYMRKENIVPIGWGKYIDEK
jgi:type I restriction-modification system, S subunit, putative